ncbi:amidohydrolase family protein [Alteromonas facilis]|uniref:amidohydrolase family protein n=1 Tax=Alteromonas facilis TaxID=2048004 RepID=UPI000C28A6C3|nr:amidohydrolase family protein [Alteromonas facilis]
MKTLAKLSIASVVSLCFSVAANAQSLAIVGGKIHTLSQQGTIENGTLLIKDGKVERVVTDGSVPEGYETIDASGKVVTPGLIGALTNLGLREVSMSAGVVDSSVKAHPVSAAGAAYDVSYAVNPDSSLFAITRIEGFTSAATGISNTGQLFNGQGAMISLADSDMPVSKPRAFVHTNVANDGVHTNGDSRAALWVALNQALAEVKAAPSNMPMGSEWHGLTSVADVTALKPVIAGDVPLLVTANRKADILQVIALKQRHPKLKLVIVEGLEAWRVADQLAQQDIPVIVNPEYNLPGGFDQMGATLANAGRLAAAGVTVAIGMETHNIRLATQHAGNAVANGLDYDAALAAVSLNVAKIYNVDNSVGSLSPGKQADVVIWSGDPLEVTEAAEQVFIAGEAVPMESRQTKLRDRYLAFGEDTSSKTSTYIRP